MRKLLIVVACIVLVLACAFSTANADDYDIQDFFLPPVLGVEASLIKTVGVTGSVNSAKFIFQAGESTSIDGCHFRATLPSVYTAPSSGLSCRISTKLHASGLVGVATVSTAAAGGVAVRCDFPAGTQDNFVLGETYFVSWSGLGYNKPANPSYACESSTVSPSVALGAGAAFGALINLLDIQAGVGAAVGAGLVVGAADKCCPNSNLYFYGSSSSVRSWKEASQCALPDDAAGSNAGKIKLSDYTIVATTGGNMQLSKTTLEANLVNSVDLKATNRTGGNNEQVPSYLWYYLPHYRAKNTIITDDKDWDAAALGIKCVLQVDGKAYTSFNSQLSPSTLVRPIDQNDQSAGIIVQCALSGVAGQVIKAGSQIKATISGVISPSASYYGDICTAYGTTSSNSHCCNDLYVSFRYGNSVNDDSVYESLDAGKCSNFYADSQSLQQSTEGVLLRDVAFLPAQVSPGVAVNNGQYRFYTTKALTVGTSMSVKLPGFTLDPVQQAQLALGLEVSVNLRLVVAGSTTPTSCAATVVRVNDALKFSFLTPFALAANAEVSIFFGTIIPTSGLPSYSQCSAGLVLGSSITTDAMCCAEFVIEISFLGRRYVAFPSSCAALPEDAAVSCETAWGYTKCCTSRTVRASLTLPTLEKCYAYACTGNNFSMDMCCTHNLYRANSQCCSNAYWCPNHCCYSISNPAPPEITHPPFMNYDRCCEPEVLQLIPNNTQICRCWELDQQQQFEELVSAGCCNMTAANGTPIENAQMVGEMAEYCQCDYLFAQLNPVAANGTATPLTPTEANAIIQQYVAVNPDFDINACCALNVTAFSETQYCDCLDGAASPTDDDIFDTAVCCAYDAWAGEVICEQTITCPDQPCTGCTGGDCCVSDRLNVNITKIVSTEDTVISVVHPPTKGCCGCCQNSTTTP